MIEEEILHQLSLVVYPIIYRLLYIPHGCLGFLPINSSSNDLPFWEISELFELCESEDLRPLAASVCEFVEGEFWGEKKKTEVEAGNGSWKFPWFDPRFYTIARYWYSH